MQIDIAFQAPKRYHRANIMLDPKSAHLGAPTSGAKIIDGRRHARHLRDELRIKAAALQAKFGAPPKLTVILVGE